MNFNIIDAPQRSEEWFKARLGRLTGSCVDDILANGRGGAESVKRRDLRMRLVCERLTGIPQDDGYVNAAMQHGIDTEASAFVAYEAETGVIVRRTGFLSHNELMTGTSLDGDIDDFTGVLELKCPKQATHLRYLRGNILPSEYMPQVTHHLWLTDAKWCDFASFDDRFPPHLQLWITRVLRDHVNLGAHERVVKAFLKEVDDELQQIAELSLKRAS